jgi:hypothetical protein
MTEYRDLTATAIEVHQPVPLAPVPYVQAPIAHTQQGVPAVQTIQLPDGRIVTGYALAPQQPEPPRPKAPISPVAVNVALGGVGFLAVCGGLMLLTSFVVALAAFVQQFMVLAAVIFGGWIAVQVLSSSSAKAGGITVNAKKAVFKRNTFKA